MPGDRYLAYNKKRLAIRCKPYSFVTRLRTMLLPVPSVSPMQSMR